MSVRPFNSFEAFLSAENANQEAAALKIPVWAGNIKEGDYFTRTTDCCGAKVTIWSQVLPYTDYDWDEGGNEIERELPYEGGDPYRFTRSFSYICPDGELGDVHISTVERLVTKKEFEAARKNGW